jgi:hypothetical protein
MIDGYQLFGRTYSPSSGYTKNKIVIFTALKASNCCVCFIFRIRLLSSQSMNNENILLILWISVSNWDSSVSIVSDYILDDRATRVRFPAVAKDFSSSLWV